MESRRLNSFAVTHTLNRNPLSLNLMFTFGSKDSAWGQGGCLFGRHFRLCHQLVVNFFTVLFTPSLVPLASIESTV
jgi:hypothetical protein